MTKSPPAAFAEPMPLVTGCAGFIGYHLTKSLLRDGQHVVGVDNLNDYYDIRLKQYRLKKLEQVAAEAGKQFQFQSADVIDPQSMADPFRQFEIDCVYSLAARAGVRHNAEDRQLYFDSNVKGTHVLLELVKRSSVRQVVLASTSSLYRGHPIPFVESALPRPPFSAYAESKWEAERAIETAAQKTNLSAAIVRLFTVFGPAGRPDMAYFRFIDQIYRGRSITVFGDGSQARDFTFIDDVVSGIKLAAKKPGFKRYNLGAGAEPLTVRQLIQLLEQKLDRQAVIDLQPRHAADLETTQANNLKARTELGWIPQVDISTGLDRCIEWYLDNIELAQAVLDRTASNARR